MRRISDDIYYIGVDDVNSPLFENQYPVPEGMAMNSYVIIDDKVAVLDTTDEHLIDPWEANLKEALQGRDIDYLVVHHMEPDHSAAAYRLLQQHEKMKVVATQKAIQLFTQFFPQADLTDRTIIVKEGDTLPLGKHSLRFFTAPMVHWPEVMVSYEQKEKILFSADAFGKFGALSKTGFTDQEDTDWACEARRYYFNICGKYGAPVQTLLKKAATLDLSLICPLHGPMLSQTINDCVALYNTWSRYEAEKHGVLIAHASAHGGTAKAAEMLAQMLREKGEEVSVIDLCHEDVSYAVEDAFMFDRVVLAASSYDAALFPPMHDLIYHLQIKAWQNKRVALIENGSWAPSAAKVMREMLGSMKNIDIIEPQITIKSRLNDTTIAELTELSKII